MIEIPVSSGTPFFYQGTGCSMIKFHILLRNSPQYSQCLSNCLVRDLQVDLFYYCYIGNAQACVVCKAHKTNVIVLALNTPLYK
jgi:hypothetical protein